MGVPIERDEPPVQVSHPHPLVARWDWDTLHSAPREALEEATGVVERSRKSGARRDLAYGLTVMGTALAVLGEIEASAACLDEAVATFRQVDDPYGLCLALIRSNVPATELGLETCLADRLDEALAIARRIGSVELEGEILNDLADGYQRAGDFERALATFMAALDAARHAGDAGLQVFVATNLALAYQQIGANDQAEPWLREALDVARASTTLSMQILPGWTLALHLRTAGALDEALAIAEESLRIATLVEDATTQLLLWRELAEIRAERGERDAALAAARTAQRVAERSGLEVRLADALLLEHRLRGPAAQDERLTSRIEDLAGDLPADTELAIRSSLHAALADIYAAQGRHADALEQLRRHLALREQEWRNGSRVAARRLAAQYNLRRAEDEAARERERSRELTAANRALAEAKHQTELLLEEVSRQAEQLRLLSIEDALTGLPNRRYLSDLVQREVERADRYDLPYCVALIDLDHFKRINDRLGHAAGDAVLAEIGRILRGAVRTTDTVARFGGEEFAISFPQTALADALLVGERLRQAVANAVWTGELSGIRTTASVGIAQHVAGANADRLFALADNALYAAKRAGRNRVRTCELSTLGAPADGRRRDDRPSPSRRTAAA